MMLISYFLQIRHSPFLFALNLSIIYTLTFLTFSSLIVCVVRDPGAVRVGTETHSEVSFGQTRTIDIEEDDEDDDTTTDLRDALRMPVVTKPVEDDFNAPHKWCRKCWAPKPERTHHCSICKRCVLKMDHHCPWLAQKCVGYWTYTAFIHLLGCITLLGCYISILSARIVYVAFLDPYLVDERTALHALFLSIYGAIFGLTVGSFFLWHLYLVTTNQTSLETLTPFLLLRYLPRLDPSHHPNSSQRPDTSNGADPGMSANPRILDHIPREHQLTSEQRRRVKYAHGEIRLYDVGWRENWRQVIGVGKRGWKGWTYRILCGGGGFGDGKTFPRNPRANNQLARLAAALADEDKID